MSALAFVRRHLHAKRTEDALWSWQQTADAQEMEMAALCSLLDQAQRVVDSLDRKPTDGCIRDVVGLAERLRRYRLMRDGLSSRRVPRSPQGVIQRDRLDLIDADAARSPQP